MSKNYQTLADKAASIFWKNLGFHYPKLLKHTRPEIILCNRLTRTAGKNYQQENKIHLAHKFFPKNCESMLDIILPHEIVHQADYNLFGESEFKHGHGKNWVIIMQQMGLVANRYHSLKI